MVDLIPAHLKVFIRAIFLAIEAVAGAVEARITLCFLLSFFFFYQPRPIYSEDFDWDVIRTIIADIDILDRAREKEREKDKRREREREIKIN